jgi:amino acid transporter
VHPRFQTPVNAIVCTSAIALILALSGSLTAIASVSALARLLMYAGTAAATLRLRSAVHASIEVKPAGFATPLGAIVPIVAIVVCVGIAAGATRGQLLWGCAALAAGAVLFVATAGLGSAGLSAPRSRP